MDDNNISLTKLSWKLIDLYFKENPDNLVAHHTESYNDFLQKGIPKIFNENNPIRFKERNDNKSKETSNQCNLYLGGRNGNKIYIGKPIIFDDNYTHYMYPNDARLREMTYGVTIHYDIEVEFKYYNKEGEFIEHTIELEKIFLGRFPIMLQSKLCILNNLPRDARFFMGECRNDYGGYFIIDGKEKVIVSQEKFANNMLYIKKNKSDNTYSFSAEIRSVSEDTSKPLRTTSVKVVAPTTVLSNNQIVVDIPNVKKPIPLFIVMRALGITSDKDIIRHCILNLEENAQFIDLFIPSVHDANKIFNQVTALEYISSFTRRDTISSTMEILSDYFLPHIGELNFIEKAYYIGYMTFNLLKVKIGIKKPTDRDNFKFKRVELTGMLLYDLFREYYLIQKKDITRKIDEEYYYHKSEYVEDDTFIEETSKSNKNKKMDKDRPKEPDKYKDNFISLITSNFKEFFKERIVEDGFRKAFKGNWGSQANTKRLGIVQDLNRLSWNTYISQVRKMNLPLDSTAKVVGPRLLNGSQWGYIDPLDTPDGGNIGLHKHLAISTHITSGGSGNSFEEWLRSIIPFKSLIESDPTYINENTMIFINGKIMGVINNPLETVELLKLYRRNGVICCFYSFTFDFTNNEIQIFTDAGRLSRPIYYISNGSVSIDRDDIKNKLEQGEVNWKEIVSGFKEKSIDNFIFKESKAYELKELYNDLPASNDSIFNILSKNQSAVDYIDCSEEENAMIAIQQSELSKNKYYTHLEIDPSLLLGVMGNQIIYPENNPSSRNAFSCGQSRQAVSVYHSNYQARIDKMGVVLNYGQIPLIKSRYLQYINREEQPYGVNTMVAIMTYTGYNVEDAILINKSAIDRGLFLTSYYSMYMSKEESSSVSGNINSKFSNIEKNNVIHKKKGYDYSYLDDSGMIKENTPLNDKMIVIGKMIASLEDKNLWIDDSVKPKKGQLGYVDKSFITDNEEGFNLAKVRIREMRKPAIGDKMASRAGQKGTIGLILNEEDMPFTKDGIKPDLIINPHALPSRMTIGQIIESLLGIACANLGTFGDCTAWQVKGNNYETYGPLLLNSGYSYTGNQILYSGLTGEQLQTDIYIGPTYYMRLKHMVKDKINYRARGPNTSLTKQPVSGRANDGGLRIGEMERDGVLAHGMSYFLNESFLTRADDYEMAICNKTGMIAVYNPSKNIFLSPQADGPLAFHTNPDGNLSIKTISKFGRSFSLIRIPYSFKLLVQELNTMNIALRIITDENINQLFNMNYSTNIMDIMNLPPLNENNYDYMYDLRRSLRKITNQINLKIGNQVTLDLNINIDENEIEQNELPEQYKTKRKSKNLVEVLKISDEQKLYQLPEGEEGKFISITREMMENPDLAMYKKTVDPDGSIDVKNLYVGPHAIISSLSKEDKVYLIQQPLQIQHKILEEIYQDYANSLVEQKQRYDKGIEKTPFVPKKFDTESSEFSVSSIPMDSDEFFIQQTPRSLQTPPTAPESPAYLPSNPNSQLSKTPTSPQFVLNSGTPPIQQISSQPITLSTPQIIITNPGMATPPVQQTDNSMQGNSEVSNINNQEDSGSKKIEGSTPEPFSINIKTPENILEVDESHETKEEEKEEDKEKEPEKKTIIFDK